MHSLSGAHWSAHSGQPRPCRFLDLLLTCTIYQVEQVINNKLVHHVDFGPQLWQVTNDYVLRSLFTFILIRLSVLHLLHRAPGAMGPREAWYKNIIPFSQSHGPQRFFRAGRQSEEDVASELLADDPLNPSFREEYDLTEAVNGPASTSSTWKRPSQTLSLRSTYCWLAVAAILLLSAVAFAWHRWLSSPVEGLDRGLLPCGPHASYAVNNHTCTSGDFLCPVVDSRRTLRCGESCYLPTAYRCVNNELSPITTSASDSNGQGAANSTVACDSKYLHLSDGLSENYFLSDCGSSSQVVVTSPLPKQQRDLGSSRLLVAWAAGNSGFVMYFKPQSRPRDSASMRLRANPGLNRTLEPLVSGVSATLELDVPTKLGTVILGSIRSLRDFIEGGRSLDDDVQSGLHYQPLAAGGVLITRQWLDRTTETFVTIRPSEGNEDHISVRKGDVTLPSGRYDLQAWHNYPFVENLASDLVFKALDQSPSQAPASDAASLSILSYGDKVVAGAWKFLTYFGRDSLLSLLLLRPVLQEGRGSIVEVILSAAIERINTGDGSVCHEEVVGDYASLLHKRQGAVSNEPLCDYKMIDTDYLLMIALEAYLVRSKIGRGRAKDFLATTADFLASNEGATYGALVQKTMGKILQATAAFEQEPIQSNLIHLHEKEAVGQWRDSSDGLGGGRTPYDVNTALVPAALRAISSFYEHNILSATAQEAGSVSRRAQFWEDNSLHFFEVDILPEKANALLDEYVSRNDYTGPKTISRPTSNVRFHGVALQAGGQGSVVPVMNIDDCFRLFLLDTTDDEQLSKFLQQTADNILAPFPLGLSTPLGLVVSNPAYSSGPGPARALTTGAYHGTVIWSWQLAMLAAGLERQLNRCDNETLGFCKNRELRQHVENAYHHLWDLVDANREHANEEVWSWTYGPGEEFHYAPLGTLPSPGGEAAVESNIQQLWSLAFLAIQRNRNFPRAMSPRTAAFDTVELLL
ncbi:uncharacterized protein B0I36DRAFT_384614 [Microdochium trichocladiopsis]|uniref:Endo-1,3(4)-beta-glucanase 1 carbohydrate binding domain-containing protein n=1 Tax=Microdochium trichocladiopsis TaxID=1682393 RepID=A0A9P8Y3F1_9PEZI|nr:uncharacterized protein B0I36DRAFT_384614 [Microdochium trichocladiopsis]KAH7029013.1 hypothetical protein B0I36DRAFT_384614 [Microdochium trichocladiopsis]